MQRAGEPARDVEGADWWLTVPQAVVLEVTRDIEAALGLTGSNPSLLVVKANLLVGVHVPIEHGSDEREAREAALRKLRATAPDGWYNQALRSLHGKLVAGVTVKGRRAPAAPLEVIDPADFSGLELADLDATSARSGAIVWYDLRIRARAQLEALRVQTRYETWDHTGDPLPKLLAWAPSTCGNDVSKLPSRDELLRLFRRQFGSVRGINGELMREVRRQLAPENAKRGGSPTHRH